MNEHSSEIKELSIKLDKLLSQAPRDKGPITLGSIFKGVMFGFFEEYAQWKYEHPYLSKLISFFRFIVFYSIILAFTWWLAGTAAGNVTGLEKVRSRVVFGYYSMVWASKGTASASNLQVQPKRFTGTIEKVVGDVLIISYYDKGKGVRRLVRPANVVITDKNGFKSWAKQYLLKGVTVDFYVPIDKASGYDVWGVVLWSNRIPINVQLVELGYAYPEKNPETEIVNSVFSQYYLKRAKSG